MRCGDAARLLSSVCREPVGLWSSDRVKALRYAITSRDGKIWMESGEPWGKGARERRVDGEKEEEGGKPEAVAGGSHAGISVARGGWRWRPTRCRRGSGGELEGRLTGGEEHCKLACYSGRRAREVAEPTTPPGSGVAG